MMTKMMSREIRLASRPNGLPTAANFTLARAREIDSTGGIGLTRAELAVRPWA